MVHICEIINAMNRKLNFLATTFLILFGAIKLLAQPTWKYSGAPIGNASTYKYNVTTGLSQTMDSLVLKHSSNQDSLKITKISGNPYGLHIYRVDQFPNFQCGLPGMLNNDRYFGVFVVANPTVAAYNWKPKYYYGGSPYVNATNEPYLQMYNRSDNAAITCPAWAALTASTNLGISGDTMAGATQYTKRMELIMTFDGVILPVTLKQFTASWSDENLGKARLKWSVNSDVHMDYYEVEKLVDENTWISIATLDNKQESKSEFEYIDGKASIQNYYRIKCVKVSTGEVEYSKIQQLERQSGKIELTNFYPNPADELYNFSVFSPSAGSLLYKITKCDGAEVTHEYLNLALGDNSIKVPVKNLEAGIYFLHAKINCAGESKIMYNKFIKK